MGSNGWKMMRFICPIIGIFFLLYAWLPETASANSLAIFRTSLGEMAVELFDDDKPLTVRNFILLSELGRYNNSFFHVDAAGVVAQGGGYWVSNPTSTSLVSSVGAVTPLGFITNEFTSGPVFSNLYGTIAMAKVAGNPDSATVQWFFNLGNNPSFDVENGGYTVFGRVIAGTNVLEQFNTRSNGFGTINAGGPFALLPVTYTGTNSPRYNELIYAGIEILKVIVAPQVDGTRVLAWNSPTGLVCRIEYRDDVTWDLLHLTNGNGLIQSVIDTNTVAAGRSYRVRIGP
jgi:cyclophilin family peptidyl-prolyl cis-trans isomerase